MEKEFLYNHSSIAVTAALFLLIILANEMGFLIGRFIQDRADGEAKVLTGSIQASILGLLALLLGFTFNMAMHRYDDRSQALITEANSIGTAMLRTQLLPEHLQENSVNLFQKYIDLRVAIGKMDMTQRDERREYNDQISTLQDQLWAIAILAAQEDPRPATTGAYIASLNEVIDSQGRRNALLQLHVPEVVLLLLFIVFIASGAIVGYSSGLSGTRLVTPTVLVAFLISMIVFIIIDLDRPKRGLIKIDQRSMVELQKE